MNPTSSDSALVIGEALVDIVDRPDNTRTEHPGGSPANVAIGLGRLGRPVLLHTCLGRDPHGDLIREHLTASNVEITERSTRDFSTSVANATLATGGTASYQFDIRWDPAPPPQHNAPVLHIGSIAAFLAPGATTVREAVEAARSTSIISFDPNIRPSMMTLDAATRTQVSDLVGAADIVKASDDDLQWLHPDRDPGDVAREWIRQGPAIVVLTRGPHGASAYSASGHEVHLPTAPGDVVDTVGAGDSMASTLIDSLWDTDLLGAEAREELHVIDEPTLRAVMDRCTRAAAITVSRPGANPPTRDELDGT